MYKKDSVHQESYIPMFKAFDGDTISQKQCINHFAQQVLTDDVKRILKEEIVSASICITKGLLKKIRKHEEMRLVDFLYYLWSICLLLGTYDSICKKQGL